LIRRVEQTEAYSLTYPLLTTASGKKMGKTEKGAVWLSAEKTSPYDYYQYWINIEDANVKKFLALFTFLPMEEVEALGNLEGADIREAKKRLAYETTKLLHGQEEAQKAQEAAHALFERNSTDFDNVPTTTISTETLAEGIDVFTIFQQTGLCQSKAEARRLLAQGGVYINEVRISDDQFKLRLADLEVGSILLRAGKKRYHRLVIG